MSNQPVIKCDRCQRRYRGQADWNATFKQGKITGYLCPDCQSPDMNAEAVINEATIDYKRGYHDPDGRLHAPLKVDEQR